MYWIYQLCKNVDDRQRRGVLCSMKTTLILDWFWMYPDNYPHPPHIMITVSVAQLGWAVNRRLVTTPVTQPLVSLTPLHRAEAGQIVFAKYKYTNHFSSFCAYWLLSTKYWLHFPIDVTSPGSMLPVCFQGSAQYFLAKSGYCGSEQDINNRHGRYPGT